MGRILSPGEKAMKETHQCHSCGTEWSHDVAEAMVGILDAEKLNERFLAVHACPKCGRFNIFHGRRDLSEKQKTTDMVVSEIFAFVAASRFVDLDAWEGSAEAKAEIVKTRQSHKTIQEYAKDGMPFDSALAIVMNDVEVATTVWEKLGEDPSVVPPAFGLPSVPDEDITVEMIAEGYADGLGEARGLAKRTRDGIAWNDADDRKAVVQEVLSLRGPNADVLVERAMVLRKIEEMFPSGVKVIPLSTETLLSFFGPAN